jgi:hypothetical protein
MFVALYPGLGVLNVMGLATPQSAILSAIIFNALIIPMLVPLALKGVKYTPMGAGPLLARNLAVYGLGGLIAPFIGIKLIDLAVGGLVWPEEATAMNKDITSSLRPAVVMTLLFALLLGLAYPLAMTGIGQLLFPRQANGSLVEEGGKVVGSTVIGQAFVSDRYFQTVPPRQARAMTG